MKGAKRILNSSLMFVFDRTYSGPSVDFKMIDIGHMEDTLSNETQDVGYIKGLVEMIKLISIIRDS